MSILGFRMPGLVQPAGPDQYPVDFLAELIDCLPPAYRPPQYQDFLQRLLTPNAEDLTRWHQVFDSLYTYLDPFACPEDWLDWITTEWFGWTLIPDGYPVARKRSLLSNLWLHYQRRNTVPGIIGLLLEFGVHAQVTDAPLYVGGYLGAEFSGSFFPENRAANWPLEIRIVVQYYDPAESDLDTYIGGYLGTLSPENLGNIYAHTARQLVTDDFVVKLCEWERAAGCRMVIEWRTAGYRPLSDSTILG